MTVSVFSASPNVMYSRFASAPKRLSDKTVRFDGSFISFKSPQNLNAPVPMLVTLSGTERLVIDQHWQKA